MLRGRPWAAAAGVVDCHRTQGGIAVELTREHTLAIEAARLAMGRVLQERAPECDGWLYVLATVTGFVTILKTSLARKEVINLINRELAEAGVAIVEKRRN
jgi:hypothetical protein